MGKVKAISRNYSQELFEVILSCLKKNPKERPTVKQLLSNWTIQMYENMCFKKEELEILSNSKLCPLLKTINMSKNSI